MNYLKLSLLSILLIPALAFAHGPARQKAVVEIEVDASPDKVWGIVNEFCSIADWNPMVTSCTATQDSEIGSVRTIEFDNGEKVTEKLFKLDAEKKKILYAMEQLEKGRIIKDLPIATLSTTITVTDNGGKSTVKLKGAFYRAFPGPTPPEDQTDAACIAAVSKLYKSGLDNIKALAEK